MIDVVNWRPGIGVGDIELGRPISEYAKHLNLEDIGDTEEDRQLVDQDLDIAVFDDYFNGDGIDAIHIYTSLKYEGRELIGTTLQEFCRIVDADPEGEVDTVQITDTICEQVYEFDSLGAQVWLRDGRMTTVAVGPIFTDDNIDHLHFPGEDDDA